MSLARLLTAASLLTVLAACGDSPKPPAPQAEATPAQTTTTVAAQAPAPATTTTVAEAAPPAQTPAPANAPAANLLAPLVGTWSADLGTCGSTPIRISTTSFEGAENRCQISGFTDNGDGSYTAAMTCNGEGTRSSERIAMRPLFGPSGEGVGLTYLDRGNEEVTVFRCLEPTAAAAK